MTAVDADDAWALRSLGGRPLQPCRRWAGR